MSSENPTSAVAVLGGGCFWCLDAVYREVRGVQRVVCGYAGGHTAAPDYEQVCSGRSGHAEVVAIYFDPAQISFRQLLEVFFAIHDPTTLNRQGNDVGSQYRSVIYCQDTSQHATASALIAELTAARAWPDPIVTEVTAAPPFHAAEDYHQDYFRHHPLQGYCQYVVAPKVLKFRQYFTEWRQ